jgi:GrpB-like predicted nucleotidyltransferase (UPF0157 family)
MRRLRRGLILRGMRDPGAPGQPGDSAGVAIRLAGHDPSWRHTFAAHAHTIATALGDRALAVEHIGSTAVEGLAAKPIVDILLVVRNSGDEANYVPQLEAVGYVLKIREPLFHEHRLLTTPGRDVHLHVLSDGSPEIERYLLFRNRLRESLDDRRRYESVKQELARRLWADMDAYATAKTDIVEQIIASARRKAARGAST